MAGNNGDRQQEQRLHGHRQTRFGRARPGCTGDVRAELAGQKNPLMRNPVIAAVIYAIVFAAICVLYTAIGLFTYFAYLILAIPVAYSSLSQPCC